MTGKEKQSMMRNNDLFMKVEHDGWDRTMGRNNIPLWSKGIRYIEPNWVYVGTVIWNSSPLTDAKNMAVDHSKYRSLVFVSHSY